MDFPFWLDPIDNSIRWDRSYGQPSTIPGSIWIVDDKMFFTDTLHSIWALRATRGIKGVYVLDPDEPAGAEVEAAVIGSFWLEASRLRFIDNQRRQRILPAGHLVPPQAVVPTHRLSSGRPSWWRRWLFAEGG